MKNNKLNKLKDTVDNTTCLPCDIGVLLNTVRSICKGSEKLATNRTCELFYEKAVLEEIPLKKYLTSIRSICSKDKQAANLLDVIISKSSKP